MQFSIYTPDEDGALIKDRLKYDDDISLFRRFALLTRVLTKEEMAWEERKDRKSKPLIVPIHPEIFGYIEDRVKGNLPEAYLFVNSKNGLPYYKNKTRRIWIS